MQIDPNILITYGAAARKYEKGNFIFHEGAMPYFFYQVLEGAVKVISSNADGKELTQGIFTTGQSFGEPPLLLQKPYPSSAQACSTVVVLRISREMFLNILKDYPEILEKFIFTFAERIYANARAVQVWVSSTPEEKILQFLKNQLPCTVGKERIAVPYTRQQIADFTGLRVETVIHTLSKMNEAGKVTIIGHKLFY